MTKDEWAPLLEELGERRSANQQMGGPEKVARYRDGGRVEARSRIAEFLDPGTFVEIGTLAGPDAIPSDAFVAGHGLVDGGPVLVGAEDFTVAGGSIGTSAASKRHRLAQLALQERVPLVMMLEGAGHRATNALEGHRPAPNDLQAMADLAGYVPTVAIVTGPSAGHGALAAPLSDFVIMVEQHASLFTAGPPLVRASLGEVVDKESLGGSAVHAVQSGVAHNVAGSVPEAFAQARRYLSYLPRNAWSRPTPTSPDEEERELVDILEMIPPNDRQPYDMRPVLDLVFDTDSVWEIQPQHGTSILTALVRLGGQPMAVVANQPMILAGSIDVAAAEKAARFIEITSSFHLPLVQLADNPGVLAGSASERAGILRSSARMFAAQRRAGVPKFHVTLRKAFGFGSSVMGMNSFDNQTVSLAFPGVTLGGIPAGVGGRTAKASSEMQEALTANEAAGPWRLAASVTYDEIIDPRELRNALLAAARLATARLTEPVEPKARVGYLP
ncbi:carboxyl transferase domain-containing protein [Nocardioides sp. AE5]|uniref:acyl-CoA carboxylase subunit beta n=1 Tax=Nocardioides sp. AE5 TaxID=2962573 RepID=UPI002881A1BF|nr:carboxyl transferase domain-containing protein [Nocardioides sp. AE5]MDT0203219.1 carboxyl transferase domain-containing protein [Nocardioides sp. AE5]